MFIKKDKIMWVLFTAHQDGSNKVKMTTRFCETHAIAVMVSKAFLNKLKADGKNFDFVSWDFEKFNLFNDFGEMKNLVDLQNAIVANPCDFGRWHDIGCNRLHQYL